MGKIKCYCVICDSFIGEYYPSVTRKTCSLKCKGELFGKTHTGKNNPNYRHGKCIENRCKECNRLIDARSIRCQKCRAIYNNSFLGKTHTDKTKKIIGKKSSEKFTTEYLERVRKVFEERGVWIPRDKLSKYTLYYRECEWDKKVPSTKDFHKTRHHRYSRFDGFKNNINPLIMKHPVNCRVINRIENISIGNKSEITKEELYKMIRKYNGEWSRHQECLVLVPEVS